MDDGKGHLDPGRQQMPQRRSDRHAHRGISLKSPPITASDASPSIQQPSAAMPSGVTECPASLSPAITVRAERIET